MSERSVMAVIPAVETIKDVLSICAGRGIFVSRPRYGDRERRCQSRLILRNGWEISVGYCPGHYCSWPRTNDVYGESKTEQEWMEATTAEVAIFTPDGSWYIPEEAHPDETTWVGAYWSAARILLLVEYISGKEA